MIGSLRFKNLLVTFHSIRLKKQTKYSIHEFLMEKIGIFLYDEKDKKRKDIIDELFL